MSHVRPSVPIIVLLASSALLVGCPSKQAPVTKKDAEQSVELVIKE